MMTKIFALLFFLSTALPVSSQQEELPDQPHTLYAEFLGNGITYSLNLDEQLKIMNHWNLHGRIGAGALNSADYMFLSFPVGLSMTRMIRQSDFHVELGAGSSFYGLYEKRFSEKRDEILLLSGNVGLLFKKKTGGLFLKLSYTPMIPIHEFSNEHAYDYSRFLFFGGIGIGYNFRFFSCMCS